MSGMGGGAAPPQPSGTAVDHHPGEPESRRRPQSSRSRSPRRRRSGEGRRRVGRRSRSRSPRSSSRSPPRTRVRSRSLSPRRNNRRSRSRSWSRSRSRSPRGRHASRDYRDRDRGRDRMGPPPYGGGYAPPPDDYRGGYGGDHGGFGRGGYHDSYGGPYGAPYGGGPYEEYPPGPFGGGGPPAPPSRGRRVRRDEGPPGVSLLVRNVSSDMTTQDLQQAFGRIGEVRDVYIPRDFHSQQPKGFAFVEYATPEMAREARDEMNRFSIKGRELEVVFAQERRKTPNEMRGRVVDGDSSKSRDRVDRGGDRGPDPAAERGPERRPDRGGDRGADRAGERGGRQLERSSSFERHKKKEREHRGGTAKPNSVAKRDDVPAQSVPPGVDAAPPRNGAGSSG